MGVDGKWKLTLPALAAGAYSLIASCSTRMARSWLDHNRCQSRSRRRLARREDRLSSRRCGRSTDGPHRPSLAGTAAPGPSIKLYDGAKLIGEATVDANGNWTVTVEPLAAGEHSLTAIETVPMVRCREPRNRSLSTCRRLNQQRARGRATANHRLAAGRECWRLQRDRL